jgi:8-oxo-dGTP pyrophosphatase MutT (NUDIX family)
MKELHLLQVGILKKLLFVPSLRYMQIKPEEIENNQFDFHIDQMVRLGYVTRLDNGSYALTASGKDFTNRMDSEQVVVPKQAKIGVVMCGMRDTGPEREFLIYTRTKHPFYGCQGFMSAKIKYGESVMEAAKRELLEESGLSGEGEPVILKHYRVYSPDKSTLLEDKFQFFCRFINPSGEVVSSEEGKNEWVVESMLEEYVQHPFVSKEEFWKNVSEVRDFDGVLKLEEIDQIGERY